MYDAAREVRFRGVSGSVVTRREGSNNLATASLAAAARPCKRFGAVLQASSFGQGLHAQVQCSSRIDSCCNL